MLDLCRCPGAHHEKACIYHPNYWDDMDEPCCPHGVVEGWCSRCLGPEPPAVKTQKEHGAN